MLLLMMMMMMTTMMMMKDISLSKQHGCTEAESLNHFMEHENAQTGREHIMYMREYILFAKFESETGAGEQLSIYFQI